MINVQLSPHHNSDISPSVLNAQPIFTSFIKLSYQYEISSKSIKWFWSKNANGRSISSSWQVRGNRRRALGLKSNELTPETCPCALYVQVLQTGCITSIRGCGTPTSSFKLITRNIDSRCFIGWLFGRVVYWSVRWLVGWGVGWLVD